MHIAYCLLTITYYLILVVIAVAISFAIYISIAIDIFIAVTIAIGIAFTVFVTFAVASFDCKLVGYFTSYGIASNHSLYGPIHWGMLPDPGKMLANRLFHFTKVGIE